MVVIKQIDSELPKTDIALDFPSHTIFCSPIDELYFINRVRDGVNVLTSTYIQAGQFIASKDLDIKYETPVIGWCDTDFENDKFTVRFGIESIGIKPKKKR